MLNARELAISKRLHRSYHANFAQSDYPKIDFTFRPPIPSLFVAKSEVD